jgi:hypothetical protein
MDLCIFLNAYFLLNEKSIDSDGRGYVEYSDFAQYVVSDDFTPSDADGVSRRIVNENRETVKELRQDQVRRQQENQLVEAHHVSGLTTDDIFEKLRFA